MISNTLASDGEAGDRKQTVEKLTYSRTKNSCSEEYLIIVKSTAERARVGAFR